VKRCVLRSAESRGDAVKQVVPKDSRCVKKLQKYRDLRKPCAHFAFQAYCVSTIWVMYRERRRVIRAHENGNDEVQPNVEVLIKVLVAFRETALKLGGLLIKLGQFLCHRKGTWKTH
jgi:hypothetical protein